MAKATTGGDALIACGHLLAELPRASVQLLLAQPEAAMGPQARRALQQLQGRVGVTVVESYASEEIVQSLLEELSAGLRFDVCIDGLIGMNFKPPVREPMASMLRAINRCSSIDFRAAVDLPSGCGDSSDHTVFKADFTYATGIAKCSLFHGMAECGRIRYLDLDFFNHPEADKLQVDQYVIHESILNPLRQLRSAWVDKRSFGHVFIVGGSSFMPGALLMAVQAAVRSGAGLVTAFAPVSVAATLAAQVPEAMWVPWPESSSGTLNPKAFPLLMERIGQADVVVVGPGMGKDRNTEMIAQEVVKFVECPVVLDADALRTRTVELVRKRKPQAGPVVVTPHQGEYMRVAKLSAADWSNKTLFQFSRSMNVFTVLKGPLTRVCDQESVYFNTVGGPVLSRGGSGDLLAGIIGGMIAQSSEDVRTSILRAVALHGAAAECMAREHGQIAVRTTQLLDHLADVLHS